MKTAGIMLSLLLSSLFLLFIHVGPTFFSWIGCKQTGQDPLCWLRPTKELIQSYGEAGKRTCDINASKEKNPQGMEEKGWETSCTEPTRAKLGTPSSASGGHRKGFWRRNLNLQTLAPSLWTWMDALGKGTFRVTLVPARHPQSSGDAWEGLIPNFSFLVSCDLHFQHNSP